MTMMLDGLTGILHAGSVRRLRTAYSGPCMRVKNESTAVEADIGFTGNWLNTTALAAHLSGAAGTVSKMYDQSLAANDGVRGPNSWAAFTPEPSPSELSGKPGLGCHSPAIEGCIRTANGTVTLDGSGVLMHVAGRSDAAQQQINTSSDDKASQYAGIMTDDSGGTVNIWANEGIRGIIHRDNSLIVARRSFGDMGVGSVAAPVSAVGVLQFTVNSSGVAQLWRDNTGGTPGSTSGSLGPGFFAYGHTGSQWGDGGFLWGWIMEAVLSSDPTQRAGFYSSWVADFAGAPAGVKSIAGSGGMI